MASRSFRSRMAALTPYGLIAVSALLAAWMIAARRADQGGVAPETDLARFQGFFPRVPDWRVRTVQLATDKLTPNIMAFEFSRTAGPSDLGPILVRLVHGYNMVDCMRIKGYGVTAVAAPPAPTSPPSAFTDAAQRWQLIDRGGETSVWVTVMLRATDLAAAGIDTRAMAFPRVGQPDDLGWNPTGLKWSSFRHPVANFRQWVRARWNASRCDWRTFLRLKRPAWVSDKYFTLVAEGPELKDPAAINTTTERLQSLLDAFHQELQRHITRPP